MKLSKDWQPSQAVMQQHKEVNHDRETKYFKHFYITNQYERQNWDIIYSEWCARQTKTKNLARTRTEKPKQSNKGNSFYHRIYTEMQDK